MPKDCQAENEWDSARLEDNSFHHLEAPPPHSTVWGAHFDRVELIAPMRVIVFLEEMKAA
jgi:hypothetical protein